MLGTVELVVTAISIGLQDTCPACQMQGRVLHSAIGREVIEGRRGRASGERAVVAQVGPEPGGLGAALGQKRHGRIVSMQPFGGNDMGTDQRVYGGARALAQAPTWSASVERLISTPSLAKRSA